MSSPINFDEPIGDWSRLAWFFDGILIFNSPALQKQPAISWQCDWSRIRNAEELIDALKEAERPHLPEIESAITLLSLSGDPDLAGVSPVALGFVRLRAETAASFLHMLEVKSGTMFPAPEISWCEAIRWVMAHWWDENGYRFTADMCISDHFGCEE